MAEDGDAQSGADPFYRDLCSARTLATAQRGFFAQLAALVTDADDADDVLASFAAAQSDEERVVAVYAMPQVRAALANASPVFRGKDAVEARRRRVAADRALLDGKLDAAVALYSQAVVRAPVTASSQPSTGAALSHGVAAEVSSKEVAVEVAVQEAGKGSGKGKRNRRRKKATGTAQVSKEGAKDVDNVGKDNATAGDKNDKQCSDPLDGAQNKNEVKGPRQDVEDKGNESEVEDESAAQDSVVGKESGEGVEKGKRRRRRKKKSAEKPPATPQATIEATPNVKTQELATPPTPAPLAAPRSATPDDAGGDDERCLGEALAGRSAALAALGRHRLCVLDVRAALAQGCAHALRTQLCQRLSASCQSLALSALANEAARAQTQVEALRVAERAARAVDGLEKKHLPQTDALAGGVHGQLHDASARLALAETSTSGRFVVAAEPLTAGDTLLVQSPHAAVAFTEADASHCHHCLVRLEAAVACDRCSALAFCSERCRALANAYHALECPFHDLLIGSGASALCRLALRIVAQRPLQFFLGLRSRMADRAAVDEAESYLRVYALETHAARRSAEDFLQRAIMALFLLRVLQRAGYFPEASADHAAHLSGEEVLIGSLLLRHLQLLQFNAHEIAETTPGVGKASSRQRSVGVGVYPTAALFNHDCHPALARHFVGSRMVLRLLRPVPLGAAVGENYGPAFARLPLALRRRALLSRYWFRCECAACRNDWPTADKLPANLFRFRCPSAGCAGILTQPLPAPTAVRCASCQRSVGLAEPAAALATALAGVDRALASADAVQLARWLDKLHALGAPPNKDMQRAEDALRGLFATMGQGTV